MDVIEDWTQPFTNLQPTIDANYIQKNFQQDDHSLPRLAPPPPKLLTLHVKLEKMNEEITSKLDANYK